MKKNKVTKIIVYASALAIGASGITYTILKKNFNDYKEYLGKQDKIVNDDFLVSAHRGLSSLAIENTREAISFAREKEYIDFIEIDVRLTKDGKLILSHDNDLLVNGKHVRISNLTYDEATSLTFNYRDTYSNNYIFNDPENLLIVERENNLSNQDYHLIGLLEAIELSQGKGILLDIKFDGNIEELCNELIRELEGIDTSNIIFQSSNVEGIRYLRDHSNFDCQLLISSKENLIYIDDFDRIGLNIYLLDSELYRELCFKNKKLALWTINNTKDLDRVLEIVGDNYKDIIYITNYPDIIVTRLRERERTK